MFLWVYSTYQSLIILYFAASLFLFILFYYEEENKENHAWRFVFYCAFVFVAGFILNEIIIRLYLGEIAYLKDQVCWGKSSVAACGVKIAVHFLCVTVTNLPVYGLGYLLSLCLLFITFLQHAPRPKKMLFAALCLLECSPFILTFYAGIGQTVRSQFALSFVIAANCGLALLWLPSQSLAKILAGVAVLGLFLNQMHGVLRLTYSDDLRTQSDVFIAHAIENRLSQKGWNKNIPVAFIGTVDQRLNNVSAVGQMIGLSMTEWGRMALHMQSMGIPIQGANAEQIKKAHRLAQTMPSYPQEGFIQALEDFYVVKLGEGLSEVESNLGLQKIHGQL